jgi:beta-mannosidase
MEWLEPGFDGWDMMAHFMAKTVGLPEAGNLEDWITRSQMTQAEGIRQALERHRTSQGRHAGSLYWSLNDVWPAVSWSSVDHAGRWKLAHHAARRANAPRAVIWDRTREDSLQFMVFNDLQSPAKGILTVTCSSIEGDVLKRDSMDVDLAGRSSAFFSFGEASSWRPKPTTSYLSWSWHIPDTPCEGSSLWTAVASAELGSPTLEISATDSSLVMTTDMYVPAVHLVANVPGRFSDNGMPLLPGARTTVRFVPESPSHDMDLQFEVRLGQ